MLNTPFMGLSVLVHICVIFGHKLFFWLPKRVWQQENSGRLARLSGFAIIAAVFLVVLTNAAILVHSSLNDRYSSIHMVSGFVGSALAYNKGQNNTANVITAFSTSSSTVPVTASSSIGIGIMPSDCPSVFNKLASLYHGSLDDYLFLRYDHYSFQFREKLAAESGIMGYTGSYEQNQVLLMRLLAKSGEMVPIDSPYCKG